jgi:hypothetical protein
MLREHHLDNGLLCPGFWSTWFEEDNDHTDYRMLEDSTASLSLEGSARIKMEAQEVEKRKTKSWFGMSFSYNDLIGKKQRHKHDVLTTPPNGEGKSKPSTIVFSKVEAFDRYLCADQPECKVDDDVASEVSLDFTDPGQQVKGQRIHISKKQKKSVPSTKDSMTKKKSKDKSTKTTSEKKQKETKNVVKEPTKEQSSSKKNTSNPSSKEMKKHVEPPKNKSSIPNKRAKAEAEKSSSMKAKKTSERENQTKKTEKELVLDDNEPISKLRFIPDLSKKELQMKARRDPPETLQQKYARESRYEYCGDPRKNRVQHMWKDQQRRGQYYQEDMMTERWNHHPHPHPKERVPIKYYDDQDYDYGYDSEESEEEDSYVDRYASGPTLPSADIAEKRARNLAIQCRKVLVDQHRSPVWNAAEEYKYYDDDELDDYAEVNDLDHPRYVPSSLYRTEEMTPVSPGRFHL